MKQALTPAALALAGALALGGCGGGGGSAAVTPTAPTAAAPTPAPTPTPTPPPTSGPATVTVAIVGSVGNAAFQPNPVRANSGDTVMFRNSDNVMHHLVMDDGSADLGQVGPGAVSQGFTLRNAAASNFHCTLHSSMVGSINGASAPEPPPCNDPLGMAASRASLGANAERRRCGPRQEVSSHTGTSGTPPAPLRPRRGRSVDAPWHHRLLGHRAGGGVQERLDRL